MLFDMKRKNIVAYIFEFMIIGSGFAFILALNPPIFTQIFILATILLIYIIFGLIQHKRHNDIHLKVVLEYILVSAIIFALFIFLNISRI